MNRTYPFVKLYTNDNTVELHNSHPSTSFSSIALKDATLEFTDNGLEVIGDQILWKFNFESVWGDDLKALDPHPDYIKIGYRTLWDQIRGIKTQYVSAGWVQLNKTAPYKVTMNTWRIIDTRVANVCREGEK